jgi:3-oxoacyl-(acyl-carrier-protein) synthase
MGTAYLMTEEAVRTGAVTPTFHEMALAAGGTRLLGKTVHTPTRVLPSPAASRVGAHEDERLKDNLPLKDRKHFYEDDNFGGLRAAAKAERIEFTDATRKHVRLVQIAAPEQRDIGLFHAGQTVALLKEVRPALALNLEVTTTPRSDANQRITPKAAGASQAALSPAVMASPRQSAVDDPAQEPIAIIGIGVKVAGALDAKTFWDNILHKHYAITEVPKDVWDPALYWNPDPSVPDKTYSKIGGFVRGFALDRKQFRIPPNTLISIDPTQQLALAATHEALNDAGLVDRDFDRSRCAVIVGNALGGDVRELTTARVQFPMFAAAMLAAARDEGMAQGAIERLLDVAERHFKAPLPPITEDSMPGELANVVAGRIANAFDLGGPSFITDAACAGSLAAVDTAVRGLRAGVYDVAVSGGADRCMSASTFVKFAKIGALAADMSCPFDARASGFVMGEGAAILILKRLSDARRDGDRVYAVIRGVGAGSDGRGKGITRPIRPASCAPARRLIARPRSTRARSACWKPMERRPAGDVVERAASRGSSRTTRLPAHSPGVGQVQHRSPQVGRGCGGSGKGGLGPAPPLAAPHL